MDSNFLNNVINSVNELSKPAYIYLVSVAIINILSLFVNPLKCKGMGYLTCAGIFLFSILLTIIMIYVVTWIIQKIYVSGYMTVAWVISIVLIFFHISDSFKTNTPPKQVVENPETDSMTQNTPNM
jgi:hypothetical protein